MERMRIEGIFLMLIVSLATFIGCCDEKEISAPTGPVSISFAISSASEQTKSGDVEAATEDELFVSRFYLGVYNAETGVLITNYICSDVSRADQNLEITSPGNSSNLYTVKNLSVPMNEKVRLLAIANYPETLNLNQSYSLLANTVVKDASLATLNFDPKSLIKVGTAVHTFTVEDRTEKIDLAQLAAKIHIKLTMEESAPSDPVYNIQTSGGDDVLALINKIIGQNNGSVKEEDFNGSSLEGKIEICKNGTSHGFGVSNVTDHQGGEKWMVVKCDSVKTRTVESWRLENHSLVINNIAISSPLVLEGGNSAAETGNLLPQATDMIDIFKGNIIELTFYTYQKNTNELIMVMRGDLQKIEQVSSCKKVNGIIHGKWNTSSGWGQGDAFEAGADQINFPTDWSDWVPGTFSAVPGTENRINGLTYEIPIQTATGILRGNYYNVTGTVKQAINSLSIDVKSWSEDDVPVHFN
ncbi:hypothetical protein [Parabacteroides sp. AF17-28]|uniref:hypothetical protein n=1 Tax=Parabacteroides sp. AF17-28 TaxID=2292241 RepID=UPI000EFFC173|nr:hypothetical protein [Parabacteroides sp. AF17-28]RHR60693.1 hypothetical protein DWW90_05645 [Parabacteroides sp. AF17-28]